MSIEHNSKTGGLSVLDQWKNRKNKVSSSLALLARKEGQIPVASYAQQRLWLLQQMDIENPFYQYGHIYKVNGTLNKAFLMKSLQLMVDRHEILRTNFVKGTNDVKLKIHTKRQLQFNQFDVSKEHEAYRIADQEVLKIYDLSQDFLIRLAMITFSENKHWLVLSMHHIIGDRGSMDMLTKAFFESYVSFCNKETVFSKPLSIQYADFALWQRTQKTKPEDLSYWKDKLSGNLPILDLPLDHKRPQQLSYTGAILSKKLSPELSTQIRKLAKDRGTTLFVLLLTAFKILLHRYSNQKDIIVGSPFINRDKVELEKLLGFFNETLVLRTQLSGELSFNDCLELVKKTNLEAFEHKNVPFDELVRAIQPIRYENINPLFQAMFLFNKANDKVLKYGGLEIEEEVMDIGVSKFDLSLFATDHENYIETAFEFSLDLFEGSTIESMLSALELILKGIINNPSLSIARIPILTEEEEQKVLVDWNDTTVPMPDFYPVHKTIEGMANLFPDKTAVVFQENTLSYLELDKQANVLATRLLKEGIKPNASIGLYIDRGVEMIAGIVGILKARATYIPLDPDYPADRIAYMLKDAQISTVVTLSRLKKKLEADQSIQTIYLDKIANDNVKHTATLPDFSTKSKATDQAYIIYTSGSTGMPKGVSISHENLWHSTLSRFYFYHSKPESFLLLSSFSFDSSVAGIFWTLCSGGKLVISPKRIEQDVSLLASLIAKHQVSHTLLLPSLYSAILKDAELKRLSSLKNVIVAGEACSQALIQQHYDCLEATDLYNEYGPTEASVWCIAHQLLPTEKTFVPIGRPIANTQVYILNKQLQLAPIGVTGALYIGGLGLSKGYLGRAGLTKEKFIPHPFSKKIGARVYKTGDLARYHKDGRIEFLGRADNQVKIRGFRVELGEIEKALMEHNQLNEAIVVVYQGEGKTQRLIAYVAPDKNITGVPFDQFLKEKLPGYMVPSLFIELAAFPRLPNGKINKHKLPNPTGYSIISKDNFVAASTPFEHQLKDVWESVLNVNSIGVNDNFFSIGGDSILSIQIVSKARDVGLLLRPNQLFEHQTIAELAKSIEGKEIVQSIEQSVLPIENPSVYPLSYLQKAFLFSSNNGQQDQGLLQLEFTIEGTIDYPAFQIAWQQTSMRHDAMRTIIKMDEQGIPHQYILVESELQWGFLDWQGKSNIEQKQALSNLREEDKKQPLVFDRAPISRMYLIQLEPNKNLLFWTCHHILLDGWSCGVILKDTLAFYEASRVGEELHLKALPNYPAFLEWKKAQDEKPAQQYWLENLKNFRQPLLFDSNSKINHKKEQNKTQFANKKRCLSKQESKQLHEFAQKNNISISTLFQGSWGILLSQFFDTSDVLFGLTVSGRFANFPEIESTSGLFMNVLPNRIRVDEEQGIIDFFKGIQKEQGQKTQFESTTFDEIQKIISWPNYVEFFESLFVFGNFLKDGLTVGKLSINHFQGGFSSAYPLTIRINPVSAIEIDWRYDTFRITQQQINWLDAQFYHLITSLLGTRSDLSLSSIKQGVDIDFQQPQLKDLSVISLDSNKKTASYVPPHNLVESQLCEIWETLFNKTNIGVEDDFFDLGGRSLMSIQLFAEIESKMGKILPPSILFQHSTIYGIAQLLKGENQIDDLNATLVPLQKKGDKSPLFCVHSGGGHVFFYQDFAAHFPKDQPVYSLQPRGLDGKEDFYETIEEMAEHYIKAIKTLQPKGPYYLLGTCFSNAVTLEMANQFQANNDEVGMLSIIDSGPVHLFGQSDNDKNPTFTRFLDMLKRGDFSRIKSKIASRFTKKKKNIPKDILKETASQKNLRLTIESLNKLYADYNWRPYNGKIHFIRSSEFNGRKDKKYHLTQWTKLALKGLEVSVVSGNHLTLFKEQEEVKGLAHQVNECIESINI